jgi:hypothetical protein
VKDTQLATMVVMLHCRLQQLYPKVTTVANRLLFVVLMLLPDVHDVALCAELVCLPAAAASHRH